MIGFRGASRYIDKAFRPCFELECRSLKRVRDEMGLVNVQIMVPFVRTLGEAKSVTQLLADNGLKRGDNGLDRDSGLVAKLFDERDDAVKAFMEMAIKACRAQNKYVGICGQGPSDHPELARWLVQQGIDSLSLNPDTVVETWMFLAAENRA